MGYNNFKCGSCGVTFKSAAEKRQHIKEHRNRKKASAVMLFSIILFIGMLAILSSLVVFSQSTFTTSSFVNNTGQNTTFITGGASTGINPPACNTTAFNNIPIIGGLIWGSVCISEYIGFMFSFVGTGSAIGWLAVILAAGIAVIIYLAVGLLRGGK